MALARWHASDAHRDAVLLAVTHVAAARQLFLYIGAPITAAIDTSALTASCITIAADWLLLSVTQLPRCTGMYSHSRDAGRYDRLPQGFDRRSPYRFYAVGERVLSQVPDPLSRRKAGVCAQVAPRYIPDTQRLTKHSIME